MHCFTRFLSSLTALATAMAAAACGSGLTLPSNAGEGGTSDSVVLTVDSTGRG